MTTHNTATGRWIPFNPTWELKALCRTAIRLRNVGFDELSYKGGEQLGKFLFDTMCLPVREIIETDILNTETRW